MIDNISHDIANILIEPAKAAGMYKQVPSSSKPRKPTNKMTWFNNSCNNSKNSYKMFKRY